MRPPYHSETLETRCTNLTYWHEPIYCFFFFGIMCLYAFPHGF